MVAFGNPVASTIAAKGAAHPPGTFAVMATFADHLARTPPASGGVDIGNGFCGAQLLAMCSGTVSMAKTYPDGSKVIRIVSDAHPDFEVAVAHCATIEVAVGQLVTRGQRIGTLGKTGASACHVHVGLKVKGVESDIWPYLDQNQEGDVIQGANPKPIVNRKTSVKVSARFRSSPFVKPDNVLTEYAAGVGGVNPDWSVEGTTVGTSKLWYGFWGGVKGQTVFGYMHESVLNPLTAIEQSGYTDADLNNAKKVAANVVSAAASSAASRF